VIWDPHHDPGTSKISPSKRFVWRPHKLLRGKVDGRPLALGVLSLGRAFGRHTIVLQFIRTGF
jgi:hypothetical protein